MRFNLNGQRAYHISYLFVATFVLYGIFLYFSQQSLLKGLTSTKLAGLQSYFEQKQQEEITRLKSRADSISATIAKLCSIQLENTQTYGLQKEGLAATLEPFMDYPEIAGIEVAGKDNLAYAAMWRSEGKNEFRTDYTLPASFRNKYGFVVRKPAMTSAGIQGTVTIYVDDRSISLASGRIKDELQRSAYDEVAKLEHHFRGTLLPQVAVLAFAMVFIMFFSRVIGRSYALIEKQRQELEAFNCQLGQMVEERTRELSTALALIDATLEATTDGVAALDGQGNLTSFNENFIRMWRLPRKEELDSHSTLEAVLDQLEDRRAAESRVQYLRAHPAADSMEMLKLKDGRIFEEYSRPQRVGTLWVGRVWSYRDVTERVNAEQEIHRLNAGLEQEVEERTRELFKAREELVRKEKLSILGQLSGCVSHELRNPLGVMRNAVYFLKLVLSDADETTKEYLEIINKEIANSQRIITDLLDFARTKTPQRAAVAVSRLVEQSLANCSIPENVVVTVGVAEGLPDVMADPLQIGQVLVNFINNAVQAMPQGGRLKIIGRPGGAGGPTQSQNAGGNFAEIAVTDSGEGISPEHMKRLFQPLFTTKAKGIGLGLVVCRNLVEANGGSIEVESRLGEGATFTVILPLVEIEACTV